MTCGCRSYLQTANGAAAEVPTNGDIPLGTEVVRVGCGARLSGSGVVVAPGTFDVSGTVTLTPVAADADEASATQELAVTLMADGQPVQGGAARAAASGVVTLAIDTTARAPRGATLTLRNVGAPASLSGVQTKTRTA